MPLYGSESHANGESLPSPGHRVGMRFGLSFHDQGMINFSVRFPVREQAGVLPVRSPALAGQVSGELDTVYLRASAGGGRARPRHGTCTSDL